MLKVKRLSINEKYVVSNEAISEFVETKQKNGFTIVAIWIRNEKEKIVSIAKQNNVV